MGQRTILLILLVLLLLFPIQGAIAQSRIPGNGNYLVETDQPANGDTVAYSMDGSFDGSAATPTGASRIRALDHSWTVSFLDTIGRTWDFYPFVPDTALTSDDVVMYNFDMEDGEPPTVFNVSGTPLVAPF